jgi:eukaryotic-like serine/threonine-protein kinase
VVYIARVGGRNVLPDTKSLEERMVRSLLGRKKRALALRYEMPSFELNADAWATLNRLLDSALDLPPAERARFVDGLPPEHESLKPRLRALLSHASIGATDAPLKTLPKIDSRLTDPSDDSSEAFQSSGTSIGPYRLLRRLARGGMGTVWLAARADGLVQRPVALKLPRGAWRRPGLSERMAREREILASLNHAHIASLYDAGLTADGQPYLALEYVEGRPIDEYARENRLDGRSCVRLFLQVTDAVAHAHARLVVHRDLKPTNILVTGEGEVRLLDFGIAKLLEQGEAQELALTEISNRAWTPAYASPEQIGGGPISVATDVYSLGVVLFEILTGARPYKLSHESRAALEEAILKFDPVRPSDAAIDASRRKSLRGDLDTILLKTLKKAPEERYATVNALADDLERYLNGRPVLAQPDSRWYRGRKFVNRNRVEVAAAALALLALLGGAIAAGIGFLRATRAETAAREQAAAAREVSEFVVRLFEIADPGENRGNSITAREILDRGAATIESELSTEPSLQASLFGTLSHVHESLGLYPESIDLAEKSLARRGSGENELERARVLSTLGRARQRMGEFAAARAALEEALVRVRLLGEERLEVASVLNNLGSLHWQLEEYEQAVARHERALEIARSAGGGEHIEVAKSLRGLGIVRNSEGDYEAALRLHREAQPIYAAFYSDSHPTLADGLDNIGLALEGLKRFEEALEYMKRALEMRKRVLGAEHPFVAYSDYNMGRVLVAQNKLEDALPLYEEGLRIREAALGRDNPTTADIVESLGILKCRMGNLDEGLSLLERSLATYERAYGPGHSEVIETHRNLVVVLLLAGRYEEVIPHLREVALNPSDPRLQIDLKDEAFDPMRGMPAFRDLAQRVESQSGPK